MLQHIVDQTLVLFGDSPIVALAAIVLGSLFVYYRLYVIRPVKLHCKPQTKFEAFLTANLPILEENYKPTFWCFESRMQTLLASAVRRTLPTIKYRREILRLKDGGEVGLDWLDNPDYTGDPAKEPIILFLPGLTGDSQSEYIKSFVNVANKEGARCVVFNNRGRGGHELKTPRTYCAANTEDLSEVIDHIHSIHPSAPLMGLGVSLGGIILGNYLAAQGEAARGKITAAMLVSICWDCFKGTESLEKPVLNRLLNIHLAYCLVRSIKECQHHFDKNSLWDLSKVFSSRTVREFDSRFTSPQFGYKDVKEYYTDACLALKVDQIKVPVLALNAEDDPFQPGDSLPLDDARQSDHVAILATRYGGHIGFMEGLLPTRYHYSDRLFAQFAKGVFQNHETIAEI